MKVSLVLPTIESITTILHFIENTIQNLSYIFSDILLYCVDHNLDVDIPKVLTHLRQQRMLMVQTIAQYKFVHTVLINYLKQSRLI